MFFFVGNPNFDLKTAVKSDIQEKISKEISDFGDIVQINMPDNENFTSAKALISLRWSMIYCPVASYLYIVSDAAIINHELLQTLLYKTNLFGGNVKALDPAWKNSKQINDSVIAGFCNFTDAKLANALNNVFNKQVKQQTSSTTKSNKKLEIYKGQYCSGLGWIVSKNVANKLWFTALRSPYLVRIMSAYLTGFMGFKANLKYLNLFEYEELIPMSSNCLKTFQLEPSKLLCAENFTIHNRYANYISTWNTGGQGQLVLSKL